jgi:hypothetical protein
LNGHWGEKVAEIELEVEVEAEVIIQSEVRNCGTEACIDDAGIMPG